MKNMSGSGEVRKRPKSKAIITLFDVTRAPEAMGYLMVTWVGIYKDSHSLGRKNDDFYDHYGDIPVLHKKIIIGIFESILGRSDGAKHQR